MKIAIKNRMTFTVPVGDTLVLAGREIEIIADNVPDNVKNAAIAGYITYQVTDTSTRRKKVENNVSESSDNEVTNFNEGDEVNASDHN